MDHSLIMVVNDDLNSRKLFSTLLTRANYRVCTAESAEEALTTLITVHPRLILMDLRLPGMDGLALTQQLKADPATHDILIVLATVYTELGNVRKAKAAGADGYMALPMENRNIIPMIKRLIEPDQEQ